MSEFNDFNIKLLCELSKLFSSESISKQDAAEIIEYFKTVKDAENSNDTMQESDVFCRLREDVPQAEFSRCDMLHNASHKTDEYIFVPKTVE